MKTFATNESNDIFLENGKLKLIDGKSAIANVCRNAVYSLQGELQYDLEYGIPYFDVLFGSKPNIDLFKYYLQRQLLSVDGVFAIKNLETKIEGEELQYTATIETNEGTVQLWQ